MRRSHPWQAWKRIQIVKLTPMQFEDEGDKYVVWGYDGPDVHTCTIWKGPVPASFVSGGYSQAQNDVDLADFEANFKEVANRAIEPRAADGKPFTLPNMFPGEVLVSFSACSDEGGRRFGGGVDGLQKTGFGDVVKDIAFDDGYFLAGGYIEWVGGSWESYFEMSVVAPASVLEDADGSGNCNTISLGEGHNLIVPAGGDGRKNLVSGVPVPFTEDESNLPNGFWSYTEPWVGRGKLTPGIPGTSKYGLLDFEKTLHVFLPKVHLFATGESVRYFQLGAVKPKWILPEWRLRVKAHNAGEGTLSVGWNMTMARRKSV